MASLLEYEEEKENLALKSFKNQNTCNDQRITAWTAHNPNYKVVKILSKDDILIAGVHGNFLTIRGKQVCSVPLGSCPDISR